MIIPAFPATLQPRILNELHNTHIGTEKMKMLARSYCYWQGIDKDIENLVKACEPCSSVKKNPCKAPLHSWEEPNKIWERIYIDHAGPFMGHYFFVVMDAKTKWIDVKILKNAPTTERTKPDLTEMFA